MINKIDSKTGLYGIIGQPIKHSKSPVIYNHGFALLEINDVYIAFDIKANELQEFVRSVKLLGIKGFNVTMPYKSDIMQYLDEITTTARAMGAVNTVVNKDGKLTGHNTDGTGMVCSLKDKGITIKGKRICLFGTGGASSAILVAMAQAGAKRIDLFNRKGIASEIFSEVTRNVEELYSECELNLYSFGDKGSLEESVSNADILINGTPLGMNPNVDDTPVENISLLRSDQIVVESVYDPIETRFLKDAKNAGCITLAGRDMLFWQGVEAFYLYTGQKLPLEEAKKNFSESF